MRGSRQLQAPDCGAPTRPSDFAAGLIRLSLLVVRGGEIFAGLPSGEPSEMAEAPSNIIVKNAAFAPAMLAVAPGTTVMFDFQEADHTIMTVSNVNADPITNNGGGPGDPVLQGRCAW